MAIGVVKIQLSNHITQNEGICASASGGIFCLAVYIPDRLMIVPIISVLITAIGRFLSAENLNEEGTAFAFMASALPIFSWGSANAMMIPIIIDSTILVKYIMTPAIAGADANCSGCLARMRNTANHPIKTDMMTAIIMPTSSSFFLISVIPLFGSRICFFFHCG